MDPTNGLTSDDLPRLQSELLVLQEDFDRAAIIKYTLKQEISTCSERLSATYSMLQRFVAVTSPSVRPASNSTRVVHFIFW